jgi:broad specificity phosphatase PhoE
MEFAEAPYNLAFLKTPVFYVGRHGRTELNEDDFFRGAENPKLSTEGKEDAADMASYFVSRPLKNILSSDMHRASETADIVGETKDIEPEFYSGLSSWDIGYISGLPEEPQAEAVVDYYVKHPDEVIPDGESLNAFRARVHPFFTKAQKIYETTGLAPLVVAHNSVVHEVGNVYNGDMNSALVKPGGLVAVFLTNTGSYRAYPVTKSETIE